MLYLNTTSISAEAVVVVGTLGTIQRNANRYIIKKIRENPSLSVIQKIVLMTTPILRKSLSMTPKEKPSFTSDLLKRLGKGLYQTAN